MFITILLIAIVAILAYFTYIFIHYLPDLKNIDINSIIEERQNDARTKILQDKISRKGLRLKRQLDTYLLPVQKVTDSWLAGIKNKVADLEEKYHGDVKNKTKQHWSISAVLSEAEELIGKKEYPLAEKKLIEVIAQDQKNLTAYELLGKLYTESKKYDQAEEVYKHLLRLVALQNSNYQKLDDIAVGNDQLAEAEIDFLSSLDAGANVASYYHSLGKVYERGDNLESALDCFLKATTVEPNSPKYLDKLIEVSIATEDRGLARKIFNHLNKIDPKNRKLKDWKSSIDKIL